MNPIEQLLDDIHRAQKWTPEARAVWYQSLNWLKQADVSELLTLITSFGRLDAADLANCDAEIAAVLSKLCEATTAEKQAAITAAMNDWMQPISLFFNGLRNANKSRTQLSRWLSRFDDDVVLGIFANHIVADPPETANDVAVAFASLFQRRSYQPNALFPALFQGITSRNLATTIVDLSNFVTREKMVDQHPGTEQKIQLATLLRALIGDLASFEKKSASEQKNISETGQQIEDSVSLSVSLCDALAQIGDEEQIGPLRQALMLSHRRLRTEAAAALVKLGDKDAAKDLVELAAEPVARLRVIAYANELGISDQIAEEFATPEAVAEAELALWLAQPVNIGLAPTEMELIDEATMFWPGYDDEIRCFLFRFTYDLGQVSFANIGISGPISHAFSADLSDLPPEDIYAAFAGWQAQHEEISETPVSDLNPQQQVEIDRLARRLHDDGHEKILPEILARFFGERVLIAGSERDNQPGIAVVDSTDIYWQPLGFTQRPLTPSDVFCIYKGRKLLRTFNTD